MIEGVFQLKLGNILEEKNKVGYTFVIIITALLMMAILCPYILVVIDKISITEAIILFFIFVLLGILSIYCFAYYRAIQGDKLILIKTYFKEIMTQIMIIFTALFIKFLYLKDTSNVNAIDTSNVNAIDASNVNGIAFGVVSIFMFVLFWIVFRSVFKNNDILEKNKWLITLRDHIYKLFMFLYHLFLLILCIVFSRQDIDKLNLSNIFIPFMIFILINALLICIPAKEKFKIEVSYVNLDYIDIIEHPIYFDDIDDEEKEEADKRIFKIKIDSNEKDISNLTIHVLNHQYYPAQIVRKNIDTSYIYYVIKNTMNTLSKLKLVLEYDEHGKRKKYRCNVYLNLFRYQTEITIYNPVMEKLNYKYKFRQPSKFLEKSPSEKQYVKELSLLLNNAYYYEDDIMLGENTELFRTQELRDIRKWILHDGKFGVGKSVLDFSFLSAQGYKTIVISPWEENYDNDFLYLIYSKIKNQGKGTNKLNNSVSIFVTAIMIALITLFWNISKETLNVIHDINIRTNLINISKLKEIDIFKYLINFREIFIIILIMFFSYKLTKILLPNAIVHSKNTTKIHQTYYVQSINNLIQKDNIMLVIEDIDRLEECACKDLFRTLSLINSRFSQRKKPLGILSYNSNNKNLKDIDYDLRNKAIYDKIFKDISLKKSMKTYFKNYITAIESVTGKSIANKDEMINKIANNRKLNFRDVHVELDKIVNQLLNEI